MTKTLNDHLEDVRRERAERLERELRDEAAARLRADKERERIAAIAAKDRCVFKHQSCGGGMGRAAKSLGAGAARIFGCPTPRCQAERPSCDGRW